MSARVGKMKVHTWTCVVVVLVLALVQVRGARLEDALTSTESAEDDSPDSSFRNVTIVRVFPIMFSRSIQTNGNVIECSDSIEEFPNFFSDEQRKQGAIVIAFVVAIYCFTIIAIICDSYFLPCVERICESLNLSQDVAAATFMSVATSAPELFVNIIGTFVTESDIGIGTVVGSSMFNTLGVASVGGLFATSPIQLDWWPLTRDTSIYIVAIMLLVTITWDGLVHWYEAMVLFFVYFLYFTVMFQNARIEKFIKRCVRSFCKTKVSEAPVKKSLELTTVSCVDVPIQRYVEHKVDLTVDVEKLDGDDDSLFHFPTGHWAKKAFFVYVWPIRFLLYCTVPDPKKHKKIFPVTFIMCVIWIGSNSYIVSWMITIIGYTLGIQDSILGLTFLAAGGCLPEAISISIMSRKGEGAMGVSNALGANTMNILLSLGFPWFVKTTVMAYTTGSKPIIDIVSGSIEYTILALVLVASTLYITLGLNKFRLSRWNGMILALFYAVFLVLAILSELIFFAKVDCADVQS